MWLMPDGGCEKCQLRPSDQTWYAMRSGSCLEKHHSSTHVCKPDALSQAEQSQSILIEGSYHKSASYCLGPPDDTGKGVAGGDETQPPDLDFDGEEGGLCS